MHRTFKRLISVFLLAASLVMCFGSISLGAALTGPGPVLVPFTTAPVPPLQIRAAAGNFTTGPWTGTWTPPALLPWSGGSSGTFNATGPLPAGTNPTGTATYDFTLLPNGNLPVGTYFRFGDVDDGSSTNEVYELRAFVGSTQLTSAWLDETIGVDDFFNLPTAAKMPEYSFAAGVYTIDGNNVPGNPGISFVLPSNTAMTKLEVIRFSSFENFSLAAPIPEPSTLALASFGFLALAWGWRRKR